jgi:ADP-heptose:LPS heptosyltransferase
MTSQNTSKLENSDRILVLTSSSTGNNVFCTPAIAFLRKNLPHALIDVVALSKLSAEVFIDNPNIHEVFVINKASKVDALAKNYTKIIALNKNALKKLSGIKSSFIPPPVLHASEHHADQLLKFVADLIGAHVDEADRQYVIATQKSSIAFLDKHLVGINQTVIHIHLGCGTTLLHGWKFFYSKRADDDKLWPIDAYIQLGLALHQAIPNLSIVVTGTKNESFLARKFKKSVPNTIDLVGKTTVSDLKALMSCVNLFIAHDCGVIHIAAASDVPIIGLFGPTNHVLTGPYPERPQHTVIKRAAMAEISVAEVVESAVQSLQKFPRIANR